jgi:hypothetical protein
MEIPLPEVGNWAKKKPREWPGVRDKSVPTSGPGADFGQGVVYEDGACIQAPPQFRVSRKTRGFGFIA